MQNSNGNPPEGYRDPTYCMSCWFSIPHTDELHDANVVQAKAWMVKHPGEPLRPQGWDSVTA